MNKPIFPLGSSKSLVVLSRLLFPPERSETPLPSTDPEFDVELADFSRQEFGNLLALAKSHHVVMRGLQVFLRVMWHTGDSRAGWAASALAAERGRIENALSFLQTICARFQTEGYDVTIIKSLDHWPDLGSDLDLYTNADSADVLQLMTRSFDAQIAPRSWGDRMACKWNFLIPGLPEAVEIHVGRLGQTGEQVGIATSLASRAGPAIFGNYTFRVPAAADRLMISTLQRMYRHFYFRLCDIVDTVSLSETTSIDYEHLCLASKGAGIWKGVASYLTIVSDYVKHYRGKGLDLPTFVKVSARFRGDELHYCRGFLRVPIMPQSAKLYGSQLINLILNREFKNSVRLSLLPCLATAAAMGKKITGSDKGIW